ncbi:MAG: hypothetical protein IKN17_05340 [Ruminococcus sp.]|nr:hypothetical protein [Ruminococcus sp.]
MLLPAVPLTEQTVPSCLARIYPSESCSSKMLRFSLAVSNADCFSSRSASMVEQVSS